MLWEALDSWPRKEILETLIRDSKNGKTGTWIAQRVMNYVNWSSDIIAHTYTCDDYLGVTLILFVPTDKMQGGTTRPYLKITSEHNTTVILSAKDDELELFKELETSLCVVEDFPEDLMQDLIDYYKD